MDNSARKAAIEACKDRKAIAGVFAVICSATGQAWVGQSRHVDSQKNSLWFMLKHGSCRRPDMQQAWREHGEAAFRFEALDLLPAETSDLRRGDELKKRAALWTARLHAAAI